MLKEHRGNHPGKAASEVHPFSIGQIEEQCALDCSAHIFVVDEDFWETIETLRLFNIV